MIKALMHCSTLNTKGGMVSVTKNYLGYKDWGEYEVKFIPTHFDTNKWVLMVYFVLQFCKIWWHVMTGDYKIAHLHTAERGSFWRKKFLMEFYHRHSIKVVMHHHAAEFEDFYEKCSEAQKRKVQEAVAGNTLKQGFKSVVVENGILADKIRKKTDYTVKNGTFHFVQVGRLNISQKGQDIFISAVNELVNVRDIRNFQVHFVGDGESRPMLQEMVQKFHLEDYVIFEGTKSQDYLFEHLADFDCFVQPSRYEGFGLTVAEAMAAGLPVLVSNIEGPMEVIDSGRVGLSFEAENIADLSDKLELILKGGYD